MSKLFWDNLVEAGDLEERIKLLAETEEERHELWHLIDNLVHHTVMECIFDHLEEEHHEEFVSMFHQYLHDEELLVYLEKKTSKNMKDLLRAQSNQVIQEILLLT